MSRRARVKRKATKRPRPAEPPAGRTDQLSKGKVLAAAQQLHNAGPIRVHERLAREAAAERDFAEWGRTHPEAGAIELVGVGSGVQLARDSAYGLLEELAFERGIDLLESPSFRDALAFLIAQRRLKYENSLGKWPDRIALALFRKRRKGGRPHNLADEILDQAKHETLNELHDLLRRADGETPDELTQEREILQYLSERSFATYPPEKAAVPPGWKETRRLEQLARHLSAHRTDRRKRGSSDYKRRAAEWMIESRHGDGGPDAELELDRLRKRKERLGPKLRT